MSPRLQSALVLIGVFLLGGITGAFVVRFAAVRRVHAMLDAPPPMARQRAFLLALDREVALDDQQREAIRQLMAAQEPRAKEIRRSIAPQMAALRAHTAEEIQKVLRPDQQAGYRRFREKREARARAFGEPMGEER